MSKLLFVEHDQPGYKPRTLRNATADVTIAIAKDFFTAGEILTKTAVLNQGKCYIPHDYNNLFQRDAILNLESKMCDHLHSIGDILGILNVAGNGIYTLQEDQEKVDDNILTLFTGLFHYLKHTPKILRSGGQTGIDEAALKAAVKLNIPALCLAPKGWVFRNVKGKDIADEKLFKERFKDFTDVAVK